MLARRTAAPPDDEEQRAHSRNGRQNVGELRSHVIRHQELRAGEGDAAHGGRREHAAQALPAAHDQDEVSRHEERDGGADASHAGAQPVERESGGEREGLDGDPDGAEGHRGGVGQQADGGGVERFEAEAGEHGRRHRHRSAEARRAFDECAESEGDEQRLQAAVVGEVPDGFFQDFEFTALQGDAVEQNRAENHPPDGEEAEGGAVGDRSGQQSHGHAVDAYGHDGGSGEAGQRRHPGGLAEYAQEEQQGENRNRGKQCREGQAIADGCIGLLPHSVSQPWMRVSFPLQNVSRNSRLTILPVPVLGSAVSLNWKRRGILNLAMRCWRKSQSAG